MSRLIASLFTLAGALVVTTAIAAANPPRITGGAATDGSSDQPGRAQQPPAVAKVGEPAPDFTLTDSEGKTHTLSGLRGKIVVIEWANPQCPVWKGLYERELMQQAQKQAKEAAPEVVWLAVNSTFNTTERENNAWLKRFRVPWPILLDLEGDVARRFDARTTPHMFIIDAKGILVYSGAFDDDPNGVKAKKGETVVNYVVSAVAQLKAGQPVKPDRTRPYGCDLKLKKPAE